jgi:hypothetical protein
MTANALTANALLDPTTRDRPSPLGSTLATQGWVLLPSLLDPELVDRLCQDLDQACQATRAIQVGNGVATNTSGTANHLLGLGQSFWDLLERQYCHDTIQQFLGGNYILNIFGGVNNQRDQPSYLLNVHRDLRSYTGDFKLMLQMLVLLDEFTADNGATYLMNGGHRYPDKPSDQEFYAKAGRAIAPRGSVVLFDSNLWHAAGPNTTDQPRRALTLGFTRPFVKQQLDLPRYLGEDLAMNDFMRQVLGYNARTPTSLEDWYQPPDKRFYKPGQG